MIWIKVTITNRVTAKIDRVKTAIYDGLQDGIQKGLGMAKDDLGRGGDPVTYPIQWDSERQRRAFFATDGFGGGIPYNRQGNIEHGFTVTPLGDGTIARARISNAEPGARFVLGDSYGAGQSRIHAGRWPIFKTVVYSFVPDITDIVTRGIQQRIAAIE